ncbi:HIV Tat-specific factor 1 homolog isoform X1 [Lingula anatina]|uniref:17S U2 SnRNP complex component HTATSF1 n=1 Tax=Lingula anatina TaxID=7574 RepID=A0A1S3KG96_LINAN|nr:HIV Tat-specific factor 1 homolog isoform X1 [Lingula anatina]|eukprot:XP_013421512.1 HIV Tat-specific factor 1 homolog isoform X1 [Lingula anatina]
MEDPEEIDFDEQLRQEEYVKKKEEDFIAKEQTYTDKDGTVFEWDEDKKAWFPKIDDDFLAQYQMNYGVSSDKDGSSAATNVSSAEPSTAPSWDTKNPPDPNDPNYQYWYWYHYYPTVTQKGTCGESGAEQKTRDPEISLKSDTNDQAQVEEEKSEQKNEADGASANSQIPDPSDPNYAYWYYYYYGHPGQTEGKTKKSAKSDDKDWADAHSRLDYYDNHFANYSGAQGDGENKDSTGDDSGQDKGKGKKGEKRKAPAHHEPPTWFEVDQNRNTNVYVSGLPANMEETEFQELMSKCGMIMYDHITRKPKIKLYRNEDGTLKGDGRCCYIKVESVDLALKILDGSSYKDHTIHVERAQFQLKGDYDPSKKKKVSNKMKRKIKEKQEKMFDWRPDKPLGTRGKHEKVVVIKHMFDPKEFETDPSLINDIRDDIRTEASKYGEVRKVIVYDRNPEGVATVAFHAPEHADLCVEAFNGRWFAKRQLVAETWDGKTKYEVKETAAEREARLKKWENFLDGGNQENKDKESAASGDQTSGKGETTAIAAETGSGAGEAGSGVSEASSKPQENT